MYPISSGTLSFGQFGALTEELHRSTVCAYFVCFFFSSVRYLSRASLSYRARWKNEISAGGVVSRLLHCAGNVQTGNRETFLFDSARPVQTYTHTHTHTRQLKCKWWMPLPLAWQHVCSSSVFGGVCFCFFLLYFCAFYICCTEHVSRRKHQLRFCALFSCNECIFLPPPPDSCLPMQPGEKKQSPLITGCNGAAWCTRSMQNGTWLSPSPAFKTMKTNRCVSVCVHACARWKLWLGDDRQQTSCVRWLPLCNTPYALQPYPETAATDRRIEPSSRILHNETERIRSSLAGTPGPQTQLHCGRVGYERRKRKKKSFGM